MDSLAAPDYWLTRFVFERALGVIYLIAFLVMMAGTGTVLVDGEEIALRPGHFVFCSPDARRQMRAGGDGLVWIGIGAAGGDS